MRNVLSPSVVVCSIALSACAGTSASSDPNAANPSEIGSPEQEATLVTPDALRLTLSAGAQTIAADTPIALVLTVTNDGEEAVTLNFANGQRYDFEVLAEDGTTVWHWADGMFFTMMLGQETLEPGASLDWTEQIEAGLASGTYRIIGTLTAMEPLRVELSLTVGG